MKIKIVNSITCPVCGCGEVNKPATYDANGRIIDFGTVNIKAFKVGDEHGWWSHCLRDHGAMVLDGVRQPVKDLWFIEKSSITGKPMFEINGKHYIR